MALGAPRKIHTGAVSVDENWTHRTHPTHYVKKNGSKRKHETSNQKFPTQQSNKCAHMKNSRMKKKHSADLPSPESIVPKPFVVLNSWLDTSSQRSAGPMALNGISFEMVRSTSYENVFQKPGVILYRLPRLAPWFIMFNIEMDQKKWRCPKLCPNHPFYHRIFHGKPSSYCGSPERLTGWPCVEFAAAPPKGWIFREHVTKVLEKHAEQKHVFKQEPALLRRNVMLGCKAKNVVG